MASLPGLSLAGASSTASDTQQQQQQQQQQQTQHAQATTRQVVLAPGNEWRFEVPSSTSITVKLLTAHQPAEDGIATTTGPNRANRPEHGATITGGTAELFGTQLAPNHLYEFPALTKAAIFTFHGCTLEIGAFGDAVLESEYVADETPMWTYLNLHAALENLRNGAAARLANQPLPNEIQGGPRVLVVGPENSGKTSLVKILTAYATRCGRTPCVINLDPKEGMLCLPGSLSACVFGSGSLLDIEDPVGGAGWGSSGITGGAGVTGGIVHLKNPLVYHYGFERPQERAEDMFKPVIRRLALAVRGRFEEDMDVKHSGMVIDTPGSLAHGKGSFDILGHVVSEFSIDIVLVLGSERLYSDLSRRYNASTGNERKVNVLKLSKSEGCVGRDEDYLRELRKAELRNYFFGNASGSSSTLANPLPSSANKHALSPHTITIDLSSLSLLRLTDPHASNADLMPLGGDAADLVSSTSSSSGIFEPVNSEAGNLMTLQGTLLTLKHARRGENHESVRDAPVMGYMYAVDVDEGKKRIKVLCPGGRAQMPWTERVAVCGGWDWEGSVGGVLLG